MGTTQYLVQIAYVGDPTPAVDAEMEYVGWAAPGSPTSHAAWRIAKLFWDANGNLSALRWAKGNRDMNNVWDNRTSITYS